MEIRSGWWGGKAGGWLLGCKGYATFFLQDAKHSALPWQRVGDPFLHQPLLSFCQFRISLCAGTWAVSEGCFCLFDWSEDPDLSSISLSKCAVHVCCPVCTGDLHAPAAGTLVSCCPTSSEVTWGSPSSGFRPYPVLCTQDFQVLGLCPYRLTRLKHGCASRDPLHCGQPSSAGRKLMLLVHKAFRESILLRDHAKHLIFRHKMHNMSFNYL